MRYSEPKPIVASVARLKNATAPAERIATHATASTASTMPATASANSTTRRVDARRAAAWCSKKFMACECPSSAFGAFSPRTGRRDGWRQNCTFGAARTSACCSAGISSRVAGAKLNMPAKMLLGNTSRLLL